MKAKNWDMKAKKCLKKIHRRPTRNWRKLSSSDWGSWESSRSSNCFCVLAASATRRKLCNCYHPILIQGNSKQRLWTIIHMLFKKISESSAYESSLAVLRKSVTSSISEKSYLLAEVHQTIMKVCNNNDATQWCCNSPRVGWILKPSPSFST